MKITTLLTLPTLLALGGSTGLAQFTYIVEGGPGGQHSSSYTDSGFAGSTGLDTAPGCTATGTRYSSTGSSFGPSRYAQATFTPTTSGYYQIALSWPSTAGEIATAVNLYTGAATGGGTDIWGNSGSPQGILASGTMDMYYKNVSTWVAFTNYPLTASTAYHVGIYAGYKTPYAGGVTPADASANRVAIGGFRFMAATPGAVINSGIADGTTGVATTGSELAWTAGQYDSRYNVWFGTSAGSLTEVAAGQSGTSFSLDSVNLQGGTQYFWRVDPVNVDVTTTGTVFGFSTVSVPEPSALALALLGGVGGLVTRARRR